MATPETKTTIEVSYVVWIVGALFGGLAGVITWLDKRAKRMLEEATADIRKEYEARLAGLEKRVTALEASDVQHRADKKAARGHIDDAIVMAAKAGQEDMIECLRQAQIAIS